MNQMKKIVSNDEWLKNSTYKSSPINDLFDDESEIKDKELIATYSDSSDNERNYHKLKKKKKRKHRKLDKKKIFIDYLSSLPSIQDENCEFRKYNFLEQMPKENRSQSFFVDVKGNPHIGRYGSIYEKHVSKYRLSEFDSNSSHKSKKSDRYYEKLKSVILDSTKSGGSNSGFRLEKRLCDSHCICHQSFIPVPFDSIPMNASQIVDEKIIASNNQSLNVLPSTDVTILNEIVKKDSHNVDAWIRLINSQNLRDRSIDPSSINVTTSETSALIDRKLAMVERALSKNPTSLKLHLVRMELGRSVWGADKLQREWTQLIFVHSTDIDLWRLYIDHIANRQSVGFSVSRVVAVYVRCFTAFFNAMSGRTKTKSVDAESIFGLCDLFSDFCEYLSQSGFSERALGSWQAMIEYNFFSPPGVKPKSSGNLLDDPMLRSFQEFWESSFIFGHPNARGWNEFCKDKNTNSSNGTYSLQSFLQQTVSETESSLLDGDDNEFEMWLKLEEIRQQSWWIPFNSMNNDTEDPDRSVSFQLIQPVLITLHDPQNITSRYPASFISQKAKKQLLLLFFDFLGVSYSRISLQEELAVNRVRWFQLEHICPINNMMNPIRRKWIRSHEFVDYCIKQLKDVLDDDSKHILSLLEISHVVKTNVMLNGNSWTQALSTAKNSVKVVLANNANNTSLWITYADLLIGLVNHQLFSKSEKARTTLINEASKVVQPLVIQVTSCSLPLSQKLHILSLSIDLFTKKYQFDSSSAVISHILSSLSPAAHILAALHSLSPPIDQRLDSLAATFTEAVNLISGTPDSLIPYWFQSVHFQIISKLISLDLEKFREWMIEECLLTITGTGSSCMWSHQFLYQLSQLLESSMSFIGWFCRSRNRNECAILRSLLSPITQVLVKIQSGIKKPILEMVLSPGFILNCIGNSSNAEGQPFKVRNFLWNLLGSFQPETDTKFNNICQSSSLLLLSMEITRLESLKTCGFDVFSGRIDRVRSTLNRILSLQSMHWKYRLIVWHSLMEFEALQQTNKRDDRTKGVFYRAVTEMPGQKSLYVAIVSFVPGMLEEVVLLLKNNLLRICAPLEEIKLLVRIRQSNNPKPTPEDSVPGQIH